MTKNPPPDLSKPLEMSFDLPCEECGTTTTLSKVCGTEANPDPGPHVLKAKCRNCGHDLMVGFDLKYADSVDDVP
jgi:hypothetical protein